MNGRDGTHLVAEPSPIFFQIDTLLRHGRALRDALAHGGAGLSRGAVGVWQRDVGALVTELSGGRKTHWLARAFGEAFLVRSTADRIVGEVDASEILDRLLEVLERARTAIAQAGGLTAAPDTDAPGRRFEFVHRRELRPILEQSHADARRALEAGQFALALRLACGVLEAIVTDALEHHGTPRAAGTPAGPIAEWLFETRVAAAQRAGLIRAGCSRLPPAAWRYRELEAASTADTHVSERDARVAGQVLQVIIRDLDPGR